MQNFKIGQVIWSISDNRPYPATVVEIEKEGNHSGYRLSDHTWIWNDTDVFTTSAAAWDQIEKRTAQDRERLTKHLASFDEITAIVAKARAAWDDTKAQAGVLAAAVRKAQDSVDDADHELINCQMYLEDCLSAQADFLADHPTASA